MTSTPCTQTTPSGRPCRHLAARCPFHPEPGPAPAPEPGAEHPDPHRYIHNALQTVVEGKSSPTVIARLVRTLEIANRLGPPPVDEDQKRAEIALHGMIMAGIAPTTPAQWELARDLYTPGALHMFTTWLAPWHPRPPEWIKDIPNPDDDLFHSVPAPLYPWTNPGSDNPFVNPDNPNETCDPIAYNSTWRPSPDPPEPHATFDPEEPPLWED